jgi:2,3,4,5-tetrahydropyridine-2-carboxylate N-succinyltransferase
VTIDSLRGAIERVAGERSPTRAEALPLVLLLLDALERGEVRAAEPVGDDWRVHAWVKQGILLGFRVGENRGIDVPPVFHFRDRDTFETWSPASTSRDVRIVPGGSVVRRGAHLADGVVVMPPAFINVGAYVGAGSMIDSHALVGSCAQVGAGVHLSAAAQVGGVLEPIGSRPVVIEDGAFVGGGCGVYEGTWVRAGAVLGSGVVLTRGVALVDLVHEVVHRARPGESLVVPERAVVVPGTRPAAGRFAESQGIHLHTPVIVKYRDARSDAAAELEAALR